MSLPIKICEDDSASTAGIDSCETADVWEGIMIEFVLIHQFFPMVKEAARHEVF